ncbi:hypothetical protein FAZ19_07380 [Sphingobacterium alkalisoli]|uniref:Uncharacterized protein n=1 Tax=Sphingobacterium alkalisoli TaxID=1874115 RepID=A0A4U0H8G7_9SPHI|nr:DUF6807 family protein [Sphingobacterium alkalisoli]TJY66732.1 hypothetical protein FAZ19_07380 [Sphingobacterium alkalisoli]
MKDSPCRPEGCSRRVPDLCPPDQDRDWVLEPGRTYVLKYRLIVFDGHMNADSIEKIWKSFSRRGELKIVLS